MYRRKDLRPTVLVLEAELFNFGTRCGYQGRAWYWPTAMRHARATAPKLQSTRHLFPRVDAIFCSAT